MADIERRFAGIGRLYGEKSLARFQSSHICVIGIGGVGSWAAEAFARSGIGKLTLVDLDMVAESNVNRQIHALDGAFGKAKVAAMAERIRAINPECQLELIEDFITKENLETLLHQRFDYIVDAIDAAQVKAALIAWCRKNRQPLIVAGAAGGKIDPSSIEIADLALTVHDSLISRVRSVLRKEYGFPREKGKKFSVPVVFSREQRLMPEKTCENIPAGITGLNCAGYGSAMCVTATFGLFAAGFVLRQMALQKC